MLGKLVLSTPPAPTDSFGSRRPTHPRVGRACTVLSVRLPSVMDMSRWSAQMSFDELGRPLRDITFCVVDLETTGGSAAGRLDDHRDRRGQGARRRGARRVPDPGQPAHLDPARSSPCSPASPTRWWPPSPPIESALPAFLEFAQGCVLVAHNAPFDVGFLKHFAAAAGTAVARLRGARHRAAGPPGGDPRRRPQLQAQLAGRRLRLRPPRPTTARCPTPAPRSTCCTG